MTEGRYTKIGAIAGVVAAVAAVISLLIVFFPKSGSGSNSATSSSMAGAISHSTSRSSTPHTSTSRAAHTGSTAAPPLDMKVVHWTYTEGPSGQSTVVVKPSLANTSRTTQATDITDFRLLVPSDEFNASAWRSIQRDPSLKPQQVTLSGSQYWAVPPNPNHATEPLPDGSTTWATIWDSPQTLSAGQSYTGSGNHTVLAFYVPIPSGDLHLTGLAYIGPPGNQPAPAVLAFSGSDGWGLEACPCDY